MYTLNDGAWIKNVAEEARMVEAMRKGGDLTVTGTSGRGTVSTDQYSLKGLAQALEKIDRECRCVTLTLSMIRVGDRRLGVRAVARRVLSQRLAAGARAGACQPPARPPSRSTPPSTAPRSRRAFASGPPRPPMGSCSRSRARNLPPTAACWRKPAHRSSASSTAACWSSAASSARSSGSCIRTRNSSPRIFAAFLALLPQRIDGRPCAMRWRCGIKLRRRRLYRPVAQVLGGSRCRGLREASADRGCDQRLRLCAARAQLRQGSRPAIRLRRSPPGPRRAQAWAGGGIPDDVPTIAGSARRKDRAGRFHLHDLGRQGPQPGGGSGADRELEVSRRRGPPLLWWSTAARSRHTVLLDTSGIGMAGPEPASHAARHQR